MKRLLLLVLALFATVLLAGSPVVAQTDVDFDFEYDTTEVMPPPELRSWVPFAEQFQLYVGFDGNTADSTPRIDILCEKKSWPYYLEKLGDTVYIFIVPPSYVLNARSAVTGLENEFPFVVWAGTQRATYWFSYDNGSIKIDTLYSAPFITTIQLKPLPGDIRTLQLKGTNKNAKVIGELLEELGGLAELTQLEDGYYDKVWGHVSRSVVRRWKLNETTFGTLLAFRCAETSCESVDAILQKYR